MQHNSSVYLSHSLSKMSITPQSGQEKSMMMDVNDFHPANTPNRLAEEPNATRSPPAAEEHRLPPPPSTPPNHPSSLPVVTAHAPPRRFLATGRFNGLQNRYVHTKPSYSDYDNRQAMDMTCVRLTPPSYDCWANKHLTCASPTAAMLIILMHTNL